jgi:hypothetical protein
MHRNAVIFLYTSIREYSKIRKCKLKQVVKVTGYQIGD